MSRGHEKRGDMAHERRIGRVEKEIREVIATYLLGGFKGDLHGFVSVSRVQVSRDLRHAKVFVTVMGTDAEREATLEALESHAYEIQGEVNRALRMKFVPRLSFAYDTGMENSIRVDQILRNLAEERKKSGVEPSLPGSEDADDTPGDEAT